VSCLFLTKLRCIKFTTFISRFASSRSSLSSIYPNYNFHFDIIKMTGILVLLSLLSATLVMTNSVYEMERKHKVLIASDCLDRHTILMNNGTAPCVTTWNNFHFQRNIWLVCLYQKTVRIDFRKFINGNPTIQGFYLKTKSVKLSEENSKVHWLVDKRNNIVKWRTLINDICCNVAD
jgi:hypothetical protein